MRFIRMNGNPTESVVKLGLVESNYEPKYQVVGEVEIRWNPDNVTVEVSRQDEAVVGSVEVIVH